MSIVNASVRRTPRCALRPVTSTLAVAVALVLAACGAGSSISPSVSSVKAFSQATYTFAACMRTHGLPSFPDPAMTDHDGEQVVDHQVPGFPDPTAQGQLTASMLARAGVDLRAPTAIAASKSCLPSGDGAITAQQLERAVLGEQ